MLNPNINGAAEPALAPLLVFPSLYQRPPSSAQLRQCRQLFYWGFLLLPCLWLLNWCRYARLAKEARDEDDGVAEMRMYVRWSLVGCIFTALLLLVSYIHSPTHTPQTHQRPAQRGGKSPTADEWSSGETVTKCSTDRCDGPVCCLLSV